MHACIYLASLPHMLEIRLNTKDTTVNKLLPLMSSQSSGEEKKVNRHSLETGSHTERARGSPGGLVQTQVAGHLPPAPTP